MKVKEQLKKDRDTLLKEKAFVEKDRDVLKAGLTKRSKNDQKIKKMVEDIQAESKAAKDELSAHKADNTKWLASMETWTVSLPNLLLLFFSYSIQNFVFAHV